MVRILKAMVVVDDMVKVMGGEVVMLTGYLFSAL